MEIFVLTTLQNSIKEYFFLSFQARNNNEFIKCHHALKKLRSRYLLFPQVSRQNLRLSSIEIIFQKKRKKEKFKIKFKNKKDQKEDQIMEKINKERKNKFLKTNSIKN
ncbi:hypothetical protein ABPG72_016659 [Tetrahymena utriculariae]